MSKRIFILYLFLSPQIARADFFGGDLPLLMKIVTNTLMTLYELQRQTGMLRDQNAGIRDKIYRIQTISDLVQPSTWKEWKNPDEAYRRLKIIYQTMPPEYRSQKSDTIEAELSRAMNTIGRLNPEADTTFKSGKELERRGADASPGVAQKLTASGVGTLIAIESQSQIMQSHVVSLLAQMLAQANERETREVVAKGTSLSGFSQNLGNKDNRFSAIALPERLSPRVSQ